MLSKKGQGESLIKLLVVAIIAVIAIALAKSYFRESSKNIETSMDTIYKATSTGASSNSPQSKSSQSLKVKSLFAYPPS